MSAVPHPAPDDRPFAVVDIGSNSGRMIVFRLREGEHLDVLEDARAPLRLARALRDSNELGADAIDRTVEALRDFVAVAKGAGADRIIAVATSAVRDAADGEELVARANRLGVPLQTIDGDHEARLGFLGAVHDLPVRSGFTMDIGGGSVELSRFRERHLMRSWSLPLGSLRVSDRFLESDPPSDKEVRALRKAVDEALDRRRDHRAHARMRSSSGSAAPCGTSRRSTSSAPSTRCRCCTATGSPNSAWAP